MSRLIDEMYELMPAVYRLRDRAPAPDPKQRSQTLTFEGLAPAAGSYTLTYGSDTTAAIAWDAGVGEIRTALEALPSIGAGNVFVGDAPNGFVIIFRGALEDLTNPVLLVDGSALVPLGSAPSVRLATAPPVLEGLFRALAEQAGIVERDIQNLYDNWFIETCDEWAVPYIGDLLGVDLQNEITGGFSTRGRVANTFAYRRRKGKITMLEQLARDTTGWPASAVEFFLRLDWHQHVNHVRIGNHRTPDLRDTNALELVGTAFDTANYSVDVRRIEVGRGWHNIPSIGLFLWRLVSYPVFQGRTCGVSGGPGRYTFDPLGRDTILFAKGESEADIDTLAAEADIPGPLRRRPPYDELNARRAALIAGVPAGDLPYFDADPVIQIWLNGEPDPLRPEEIRCCDLSTWVRPDPDVVIGPTKIRAAFDPVLGRVMPAKGEANRPPLVSFSYGFPGNIGAGPYDRTDAVANLVQIAGRPDDPELPQPTWHRGVRKDLDAGEPRIVDTIDAAVTEWNGAPANTVGIISLMDSDRYAETLLIEMKTGQRLFIIAGDWRQTVDDFGVPQTRVVGDIVPTGVRPCMPGKLEIRGPVEDDATAEVHIDGLMMRGSISITTGSLRRFSFGHSTGHRQTAPTDVFLNVADSHDDLEIAIRQSVIGAIDAGNGTEDVIITDSVVEGSASSLDAPVAHTDIESSTLMAAVSVRTMDASNSIFLGTAICERRQSGCVRFCYLSPNSATGRRFRCQPDLALAAAEQAKGSPLDADEETVIRDQLRPGFTSRDLVNPAYSQLSRRTDWRIVEGADDGSEMGAWRFLKQPQRRANLRTAVTDYLPFAMEAGAIEVN